MILLDKELMATSEYEQVSSEAIKNGLKKDGVFVLKNLNRWDG